MPPTAKSSSTRFVLLMELGVSSSRLSSVRRMKSRSDSTRSRVLWSLVSSARWSMRWMFSGEATIDEQNVCHTTSGSSCESGTGGNGSRSISTMIAESASSGRPEKW